MSAIIKLVLDWLLEQLEEILFLHLRDAQLRQSIMDQLRARASEAPKHLQEPIVEPFSNIERQLMQQAAESKHE